MVKVTRMRCWLLLLATWILLLVCGCQSSSDNAVQYDPTGSWQGTITAPDGTSYPVQGLIAPDQSFHFALQGADGGWALGEFSGNLGAAKDGLGNGAGVLRRIGEELASGNITYHQDAATLVGNADLSSAGRWTFALQQTSLASEPALLSDAQRGWGLATGQSLPRVHLGKPETFFPITYGPYECRYKGNIESPAGWEGWNIFRLNLVVDGCSSAGEYTGLASLQHDEQGGVNGLWVTLAVQGGWGKFIAGQWYLLHNNRPFSDPGPNFHRRLKNGMSIALDGTRSNDPDNDVIVNYNWRVASAPVGSLAQLTTPTAATPSFTPDVAGPYTFELVVGDSDLVSTPTSVTVDASFASGAERFYDQGNGTVIDYTTQLVWVKDVALCNNNFTGYTWAEANAVVAGLGQGACGLSDQSQAGDWLLPANRDLYNVQSLTSDPQLPKLDNSAGTGKWSQGDPFIFPITTVGDPLWDNYWFWVREQLLPFIYRTLLNKNLASQQEASPGTNRWALWPVRTLRSNESSGPPPAL